MPNHVIYIPVHLEKVLSSLKKEEESLTQCAKRILTAVLEQSTINRSNVEVLPSQLPSQVTSLPSDSLLTTDYLDRLNELEQALTQVTSQVANLGAAIPAIPGGLAGRLEILEQELTQVTSQVTNLPTDSLLTTDYLDRLNELEHKVEAVSSVVEAITTTPTPSIPDGLEARLEILEQLANAPLAVETLPIELQEWIEGADSRLQSLAGREAATLPDELSKKISELEENLALLLEVSAKGVVLPAPLMERFERIDKLEAQLETFRELLSEAYSQLNILQAERETPSSAVSVEEGILPCLVDEEAPKKKAGRPSKNKNLSAPL